MHRLARHPIRAFPKQMKSRQTRFRSQRKSRVHVQVLTCWHVLIGCIMGAINETDEPHEHPGLPRST